MTNINILTRNNLSDSMEKGWNRMSRTLSECSKYEEGMLKYQHAPEKGFNKKSVWEGEC